MAQEWPGSEAGAGQDIRSLSGAIGHFRRSRGATGVSVTSTAAPLIPANIRRVSAFVLNLDLNNTVRLGFGCSPSDTNAMSVTIDPGAYFQIDALFPWTGAVWAYSASGATVDWGETEATF